MSQSDQPDIRETLLTVAEACDANDYERAEDGLLDALGAVRPRQGGGGNE